MLVGMGTPEQARTHMRAEAGVFTQRHAHAYHVQLATSVPQSCGSQRGQPRMDSRASPTTCLLLLPRLNWSPFLQAQLPQNLSLCGWSCLLPLRLLPRPSKNGPVTPGQPLLLSHRNPSSHRPGHGGDGQRDRWKGAHALHQGPWQYQSPLS